MADLARAITDELSIRNLVARYADAVNRRDTDAWAATWSKGGEWNVMGNPAKGREAVVALFQQLMGGLSWVVQLPYSGTIEVAGDEGGGRWYLGEFMKRQYLGGSIAVSPRTVKYGVMEVADGVDIRMQMEDEEDLGVVEFDLRALRAMRKKFSHQDLVPEGLG